MVTAAEVFQVPVSDSAHRAWVPRQLVADSLPTPVSSEVVLAEFREVLGRRGRLPAAQIEAIEVFLQDQPVAPRPQQTLQLRFEEADDE